MDFGHSVEILTSEGRTLVEPPPPCRTYMDWKKRVETSMGDAHIFLPIHETNAVPLPNYFPTNRQYRVVMVLPEGLDPSKVPFMWDVQVSPEQGGAVAVVFWDGHVLPSRDAKSMAVKRIDMSGLERILEECRKANGGQTLEIRPGRNGYSESLRR